MNASVFVGSSNIDYLALFYLIFILFVYFTRSLFYLCQTPSFYLQAV